MRAELRETQELRLWGSHGFASGAFSGIANATQAGMRVWVAALLLCIASAPPPLRAARGERDTQAARSRGDSPSHVGQRYQRNQRILSQKELEAAMAPHVPAIQRCYKTHAAKQRSARGELQLEMLIRPEGKVHRLWVRAPGVRGKQLGACIDKLSTRWIFPKKPGFTNAIMPFLFRKTNARGSGPLPSCRRAKGCSDKRGPKSQ